MPSTTHIAWAFFTACCIVAAIIVFSADSAETVPAGDHVGKVPPVLPLAYTQTINVSSSKAFVVVEGQVTNMSSSRMDSIQVVVSLFDHLGNFIAAEKSLVEFRPLLPSQTSPYSTMIPYNPAITSYSTQFVDMSGQVLPATQVPQRK